MWHRPNEKSEPHTGSLQVLRCAVPGLPLPHTQSLVISFITPGKPSSENSRMQNLAFPNYIWFFFQSQPHSRKKKKSLQEAQNGYEVWVLIPKNDIHNSLFHQAQTCSTFQGGAISYLKMTWRLLFSMMNSFPCGLHFCHLPCLWFQRKGELCKRQRLRTSGPGAWYAIGMNREGHRG